MVETILRCTFLFVENAGGDLLFFGVGMCVG